MIESEFDRKQEFFTGMWIVPVYLKGQNNLGFPF